jgi:hypothetical protein
MYRTEFFWIFPLLRPKNKPPGHRRLFYSTCSDSLWLKGNNIGLLHLERHERAQCFQRTRGHYGQGTKKKLLIKLNFDTESYRICSHTIAQKSLKRWYGTVSFLFFDILVGWVEDKKNANVKLSLKFSETPKPYFLKSWISKRLWHFLGARCFFSPMELSPGCLPTISNIRRIREGMLTLMIFWDLSLYLRVHIQVP